MNDVRKMQAGDLVRIKEIPGTKLASKRNPMWGVIGDNRSTSWIKEEEKWVMVHLLKPIQQSARYASRTRVSLQRRHFDYPTDKQIPDWVFIELANRVLKVENVDG